MYQNYHKVGLTGTRFLESKVVLIQVLAPVQAWGGPAGEQLCGERPGSAGG